MAQKVLLSRYYSPTLLADIAKFVTLCEYCQKHQPLSYHPTKQLKTSTVSYPFDQWGINIVGPFSTGSRQKKFLLVIVDYFSKWVKAEALTQITEDAIMKVLWQNIVSQYGIPHKIVSNNGRQF